MLVGERSEPFQSGLLPNQVSVMRVGNILVLITRSEDTFALSHKLRISKCYLDFMGQAKDYLAVKTFFSLNHKNIFSFFWCKISFLVFF